MLASILSTSETQGKEQHRLLWDPEVDNEGNWAALKSPWSGQCFLVALAKRAWWEILSYIHGNEFLPIKDMAAVPNLYPAMYIGVGDAHLSPSGLCSSGNTL